MIFNCLAFFTQSHPFKRLNNLQLLFLQQQIKPINPKNIPSDFTMESQPSLVIGSHSQPAITIPSRTPFNTSFSALNPVTTSFVAVNTSFGVPNASKREKDHYFSSNFHLDHLTDGERKGNIQIDSRLDEPMGKVGNRPQLVYPVFNEASNIRYYGAVSNGQYNQTVFGGQLQRRQNYGFDDRFQAVTNQNKNLDTTKDKQRILKPVSQRKALSPKNPSKTEKIHKQTEDTLVQKPKSNKGSKQTNRGGKYNLYSCLDEPYERAIQYGCVGLTCPSNQIIARHKEYDWRD